MSQGSWENQDQLLIQYGTQKANPETAGDYLAYGQVRCMEVLIDLVSLSTNPQIQSTTTFFPAGYNVFVERVELDVDQASAGGTSFSVGLGYPTPGTTTYNTITTRLEQSTTSGYVFTNTVTASMPAVTSLTNTGFVNALVNASTNTAGDYLVLSAGSSGAGGLIGTTETTTNEPCYITALAAGTYTAGFVRCRVYYRGFGTIVN